MAHSPHALLPRLPAWLLGTPHAGRVRPAPTVLCAPLERQRLVLGPQLGERQLALLQLRAQAVDLVPQQPRLALRVAGRRVGG